MAFDRSYLYSIGFTHQIDRILKIYSQSNYDITLCGLSKNATVPVLYLKCLYMQSASHIIFLHDKYFICIYFNRIEYSDTIRIVMYSYGKWMSYKILEYDVTSRTSDIDLKAVYDADIPYALKLKIRCTEFSECSKMLFDFSDSELDDDVLEFLNTICITHQGNTKFINNIMYLNTIFK